MLKRSFSVLLVAILLLGVLTGCNKSNLISGEKAQQIVLEDLGISADKAELHLHVGEYKGDPCYCVYVTINGQTLEYLIDNVTGEILSISESNHKH